jgi:hypothetical protein
VPGTSTAFTTILIATQAFANLGIVKPGYIVPAGFLFTGGSATVSYTGVDSLAYASLPLDRTLSINRSGATAINSPKNFAGVTGTVHGNVFAGNDTLASIERFKFADMNLAFDLAQGRAAGNSVRIIGAAFDANSIIPQYVGIGLQLLDSGRTMLQVCRLAVDTPLFLSPAGSHGNADFVTLVRSNVVGVLPSPTDLDH